jgi:alanine-synthesizing transaminase
VFIGNGVQRADRHRACARCSTRRRGAAASPDYPLWSAATILNDGAPVYYDCTAANGFLPDPAQVEALVTPRTRALVIINPNNPDRRRVSARVAGKTGRDRASGTICC